MGTIVQGQRRQVLAAVTRVGRTPDCLLRLDNPQVSRAHALLWWNNLGWVVRDLGSTNGVYVNSERLSAAQRRQLNAGDTVAFGSLETPWTLEETSPPDLLAQNLDTGQTRVPQDGVLSLPDSTSALYTLSSVEGHVIVSTVGASERALADKEILLVEQERWRIHLPSTFPSTLRSAGGQDTAQAELEFSVSLDEEHVEVTLRWLQTETVFPSRADLYLLLTLARRRVQDAKAGLPPQESGWYDVDALCDDLRMSEAHLNVQIHRLRARMPQLSGLGPGGIIERRMRTLRIAVKRLILP